MIFFENHIFMLFLTLVLYSVGITLTEKYRIAIFNPIIFSMLILISYCMIFKIPYEKYEEAGQYIDFFLKPSIVSLAIPLYLQWEKIKKQLLPIFISQLVGCIMGILSVIFLAKLFGAEDQIILSLVPKSVTTPIALEISNSLNGIPAITAAAVLITGIFGSMTGFKILNLFKIRRPISQGIAIGTSSHALGVMKALDISNKYGAFASVGMIVNGILTAILSPIVLHLIGYS